MSPSRTNRRNELRFNIRAASSARLISDPRCRSERMSVSWIPVLITQVVSGECYGVMKFAQILGHLRQYRGESMPFLQWLAQLLRRRDILLGYSAAFPKEELFHLLDD